MENKESTPNRRGRGTRALAWEKLGDFVLNKGSGRLLTILNNMDDEEFIEAYLKLINYFKPRMASNTIKSDSDVTINVVSINKDILKDI